MKTLNLGAAWELMTEWQQCFDEGLDVEKFRDICAKLNADARVTDWRQVEPVAQSLFEVMENAPVRQDYKFVEPSALDEIKAARPDRRHSFTVLSRGALADKIKGAWLGRIAGCLCGKPVEGYRSGRLNALLTGTGNFPMKGYIYRRDMTDEVKKSCDVWENACWADNLDGIAPSDDDTNYTTFALKLLDRHGRNFMPADVISEWGSLLPANATFTAERVAYRNYLAGLLPPDSAAFFNPFREYIGAQIRGDFFGYINPGDPEAAADMAWRDASISHVKNGIYGEMFIAAILAAAGAVEYKSAADIRTVIEAGLDEIPRQSRLRADVEKVIAVYDSGASDGDVYALIHSLYDENTGYGWCHTNSNAMIVTYGLLYGGGDYGSTVCRAVGCAFDTDCNGATCGSIIGMLRGTAAVGDEWTSPFCGRLRTDVAGYNVTDVKSLAESTMRHLI